MLRRIPSIMYIKKTYTLKEGTVPVPPDRSCANVMGLLLPYQGLPHWGTQVAGVNLHELASLLNISPKLKKRMSGQLGNRVKLHIIIGPVNQDFFQTVIGYLVIPAHGFYRNMGIKDNDLIFLFCTGNGIINFVDGISVAQIIDSYSLYEEWPEPYS